MLWMIPVEGSIFQLPLEGFKFCYPGTFYPGTCYLEPMWGNLYIVWAQPDSVALDGHPLLLCSKSHDWVVGGGIKIKVHWNKK